MRTESIPRLEPPHIHSYPAEWRSDATKHWRECECGEKAEQAAHNWGAGVVTTAPSSSKAGVRTYAQDSMAWAKAIGLINGTGKGKIDPTGVATRGQTATIFARFYKVVIQNK